MVVELCTGFVCVARVLCFIVFSRTGHGGCFLFCGWREVVFVVYM